MKCSFDPTKPPYDTAPIGMFHCPECGEMVVAGIPHPNYEEEVPMKTKNLDKVLKDHKPTCTMHVYSDGKNRHCSCGRDKAIIERDVLMEGMKWLLKAHQYFEDHDTISENSEAGKELEEIIQRAKNEKIIGKE